MMNLTLVNLAVLVLVSTWSEEVNSFQPIPSSGVQGTTTSSRSLSSLSPLFSTPPPRKPRRSLQKRRKRNKEQEFGRFEAVEDDFPWDTAESRPLLKAEAKEAGEDYWIDEKDLQKQAERSKPPKRLEGQVTDEQLWGEVLSPYKQNWIGLFSVVVVVLAVIVSQFPELLQTPIIAIPDL
eukprot:scaffold10861_cov180-Amphora_coffeaeformis.AAC.38